MNVTEVMRELERLGTEQNRKVYRRHGAGEVLFGVSFAHMYTFQKRIKRDQELAEQLWATGNADARTLAAMIADPAHFTAERIDAWLTGVRYPMLIDLVIKHLVADAPFARELMERWTASNDEWIGRAGWTLAGCLAASPTPLPDAFFEAQLKAIEGAIHRAKNRARQAMNGALINIGARNGALRDKAIAAARRIGKVTIDHGDTDCKTPDAAGYIEKMWIRKEQAGKALPAKTKAAVARAKAPSPGAAKARAGRAEPAAPATKKSTKTARRAAGRS